MADLHISFINARQLTLGRHHVMTRREKILRKIVDLDWTHSTLHPLS